MTNEKTFKNWISGSTYNLKVGFISLNSGTVNTPDRKTGKSHICELIKMGFNLFSSCSKFKNMKLLALFSDVLLLADETREIEFLHIADNPMVCGNLPSLNVVRSFNEIVGGLLNYEKPVICDPSNQKCFYITENRIKPKAHIY